MNDEEIPDWIRLSLVFPYGSQKPAQLLSLLESPGQFFRMERGEMARLGFLTEKELNAAKTVSPERARIILEDCKRRHISIVTYGEESYPGRLRQIYGPPMVLYYAGNIDGLNDSLAIAVVGTRMTTEYSAIVTEYLSHELAAAGAVIVSGCAVGGDAAAHRGALEAGGRTVGVLACGLDVDYPSENHALKAQILRSGGALFTEYPPGTPCATYFFTVRNRLIAGLSAGVLVTHAPERSGSLITAEHALEQGKEVFCVPPYSIFDPEFSGVVRYLRDGAVPVFGPDDILGMYTESDALRLSAGDYLAQKKLTGKLETIQKPKLPDAKASVSADAAERREALKQKYAEPLARLDETHLKVWNTLGFEPLPADELMTRAGLGAGVLLAVLTELEIEGLAESYSGRRFALSEK